MKIWLRNLTKQDFIRNVATVATGTAAMQAIVMLFSPVITRLYGPEAYGLQGVFTSLVGLLSIVAGLSYPTAIVLPEDDNNALVISYLSIYIAIFISLLTFAILFLFRLEFLNILNAGKSSAFLYLIPVAIFISVLNRIQSQWLIRKKAYMVIAKYGVLTTFLLNSAKAVLGSFHPSAIVLIATNTFGVFFGSVMTYFGWRRTGIKQLFTRKSQKNSETIFQLARHYNDFPLLRTPQDLINAASQSLPLLLLASYFGANAAGQYSIAIAVLGVPSGLIGGSVMAVFYPRINDAIRHGQNARDLIVRATLGMAFTGGVPFLIVIVAGPFLFETVFGDNWHTAGIYAQWLSPWLFLQDVNKPAVSAIPALRLQGGLLIYELFSTGTKIFALWLGYNFWGDDVGAIALFSMFGCAAYVWLILWVICQSSRKQKNIRCA